MSPTRSVGYCVILGRKELRPDELEGHNLMSTRRGAALLLRTRAFTAGAEEDEEQTSHSGRIAMREVVLWEEQVYQFASIYAPAMTEERTDFWNSLIADNPFSADTILGGST